MQCTEPNCGADTLCKGYCRKHYAKHKRAGAFGGAKCSITECSNVAETRGMCQNHYMRWLRVNGPKICCVAKCCSPATNHEMCVKHAWRVKKHGDPNILKIRKQGTGTISSGGYKQISKPGHSCADKRGLVMEHRLVMCEILGRPLRPQEKIHHKNGNRLDNRPENLELWTVGQHPAGQRVEDLAAFARRILTDNGLSVVPGQPQIAHLPARELANVRRRKLPNGYVDVFVPGFPGAGNKGRIREHRYVMSLMLGRPLDEWENVHHKNGVRSDNQPKNLELWCRRQPSGQRTSDLIKFARDIIALYR